MAKLSDVLNGITILSRYLPKGMEEHAIDAQHDVIYAGGPEAVTDEDRAALDAAGWFWAEDVGSWARFT